MTEEQKQALIDHAKSWIADSEAMRDEIPFGFDDDTEKELSLIKIALAALTAPPVEYRLLNESGEVMAHRDTLHEAELCIASWNKNWKIEPLFTSAAPAADLAALVPDKWYFQLTFDIPNLENMTPYQAHGAAWEQCRTAILRNIEEAK